MLHRWLIRQRLALVIGLGVTTAAAIIHGTGLTERAELQFYDGLVRHFSRVPACGRILHVDIDDDALQRYKVWPWPRDTQADLVRILHELGAEKIVVDITWSEPTADEIRTPNLDPYAELEGGIEQIGELSAENIVSPDRELADAIRNAGPVYLAFYYDNTKDACSASPLASRMADLLRRDFSLSAQDLADRLETRPQEIEPILAGVKRSVARALIGAKMKTVPRPTVREIHESLLKTPFERLTADRQDILAAYYRELGLQNLRRLCPPVPATLKGKLPVVRDVIPPIRRLTDRSSPRLGFANFDAESEVDGTLRRIPLMVEWEGLLLEQLAFAAVRDSLGIHPEEMSVDGSSLLIKARGDRPELRIQLDQKGQILINWHARAREWRTCFKHLPVLQLLRIHEARLRMRQNEALRQTLLGRAMRLVSDERAFAGYRELVSRLLDRRRFVHRAVLEDREQAPEVQQAQNELEELTRTIDQQHARSTPFIRETWSELSREPDPDDPAIAEDYRRFREAHEIIEEQVPQIEAINRSLSAGEAELLEKLRPRVAGKICFLGYTATALADMVTAPPYDRMPGVLIHSNVYNSFIHKQFRQWAGLGTRLCLIFVFGSVITGVTTLRRPQTSLLFVLGWIGLTLAITAFGLFDRWNQWVQVLTALITTFIAWALIVMVRYLVTDRQRRQFSKAVSQYVSPAMVRQIADSAQDFSFSPVEADVSCLFSDLAGFTPLSERLGPAGTRAVLNPYLQSMSAVLHRHQALINKFIGDGVFAFFNPPILPCPTHQVAACEAALDSRQALAELITRHVGTPLSEGFRQLFMRIGIASGPVFVGDFGSEDKLDYTCMGDVVNLAARLESANKQFGTGILICGLTRQAAGERFVYRHLGILVVKGQTRGLPVYELLGRRGEVNGQIEAQAGLFERAVMDFCQRDFPAALARFDQCLAARPGDLAARRYLSQIRHFQAEPPGPDWRGAIELTEK